MICVLYVYKPSFTVCFCEVLFCVFLLEISLLRSIKILLSALLTQHMSLHNIITALLTQQIISSITVIDTLHIYKHHSNSLNSIRHVRTTLLLPVSTKQNTCMYAQCYCPVSNIDWYVKKKKHNYVILGVRHTWYFLNNSHTNFTYNYL